MYELPNELPNELLNDLKLTILGIRKFWENHWNSWNWLRVPIAHPKGKFWKLESGKLRKIGSKAFERKSDFT